MKKKLQWYWQKMEAVIMILIRNENKIQWYWQKMEEAIMILIEHERRYNDTDMNTDMKTKLQWYW